MSLNLEIEAARFKLDFLTCEELTELANNTLNSGIYCDAFSDIVTENYTLEEAKAKFKSGLNELEIAIPQFDEAVWIVLKEHIGQISSGSLSPKEGMKKIVREVVHAANLHDLSKEYLGDSHEIHELLSAYYSFDDIEDSKMDVTYDGKSGKEAMDAIENRIIALANEWLIKAN